MEFHERYGPWAVVAGASEGVGASAARMLGERGVNVVLVARRKVLLDQVAATVGAETRTVELDLSRPDAADALAEAAADLDVGLFIYNAGSVHPAPFAEKARDHWLSVVRRNCATVVGAAHHFARPMVERGRGGIVVVGAQAGWAGASQHAVYAATKRFGLLFAESLWAEFAAKGVDVLAMVLGATDSTVLREVLKGKVIPMATPDEAARDMLDNIANGPTFPPGPAQHGTLSRREAVETRSAGLAAIM